MSKVSVLAIGTRVRVEGWECVGVIMGFRASAPPGATGSGVTYEVEMEHTRGHPWPATRESKPDFRVKEI